MDIHTCSEAKEEGVVPENMQIYIKNKVGRALFNDRVEDEHFYIVHTNDFCLTAKGGVVPAELSLARMFLRKVVEDTYHVFIEPGTLPKGYRADCSENSKSAQDTAVLILVQWQLPADSRGCSSLPSLTVAWGGASTVLPVYV